jgi:hypothetical protein
VYKSEESHIEIKMFFVCKCILLGDSRVGKTTFLQNYLSEAMGSPTETIGIDFRFLPGFPKARVMLWDISGKELFRPIIKPHYRNTHVAFFIYDVSNRATFQNIPRWSREYQQLATPLTMVLVANVGATPAVVTPEEGRALATTLGMKFVLADLRHDPVSPWVTNLIQNSLVLLTPRCPPPPPDVRRRCFASWKIILS